MSGKYELPYFNFPEALRRLSCPACGREHLVEVDIIGFMPDRVYDEVIVCGCGAITQLVFTGFDENGYNFVTKTYPKGTIDYSHSHITPN